MEHALVLEDMKPKDDLHQPVDSPEHHDAKAQRSSTDSPMQRFGDRHNPTDPVTVKRVSRASGGSDRSVELSPLHRSQVKAHGERRFSSEGRHGVAPNTPSRLRTRAGGRGDESPDKGPTVPKFGGWDEDNPSSGDGYTGIFDKVREEKQMAGSAKVPNITDDSVYLARYGHSSSSSKSAVSALSIPAGKDSGKISKLWAVVASAGAKSDEFATEDFMKLGL